MSYVNRDQSKQKAVTGLISLGITSLIIAGLVVAFNINVLKKVTTRLISEDVKKKEEPKKEPPKKIEFKPPPTVIKPPEIKIAQPQTPLPPPPPPPPAQTPPPPPPVVQEKPHVIVRAKNTASISPTEDDYPSDAVRDGVSGTTSVSATISASGAVTSCTATGGTPSLNAAACRLVKRGRFTPATEDGKPVESNFTTRIRWQLAAE
jgi:periplasmic protein TonB